MSGAATLRVRVQDAWDELVLPYDKRQTVAKLKAQALKAAHRPADPAGYELKFRGAAVLDEGDTLEALGVPAGAGLIVLKRRRQAVR
ncbi:MAG TPA: hypothetical protein VFS07_05490 [Gemmatimonadales bacterium]|jgi:hypothetical protein|nr:hypothetical protein [Gemmatimonadales bacterium]HVX90041.1 hypothetical protein [Gemmatimonadales bacterium]